MKDSELAKALEILRKHRARLLKSIDPRTWTAKQGSCGVGCETRLRNETS